MLARGIDSANLGYRLHCSTARMIGFRRKFLMEPTQTVGPKTIEVCFRDSFILVIIIRHWRPHILPSGRQYNLALIHYMMPCPKNSVILHITGRWRLARYWRWQVVPPWGTVWTSDGLEKVWLWWGCSRRRATSMCLDLWQSTASFKFDWI